MSNDKPTPYEPGEVLLSAEEVSRLVTRLGREISADYKDRHPVLVNLLKGGFVLAADLIRQLEIPHQIDFLSVSSYEDGTSSSGIVRIVEDLRTNIRDRDVLVVEDVLDTGRTLAYIVDVLRIRSPRSIEICALLSKRKPRPRWELPVRYVGQEIPDVFVVGYGLDFNEKFRNLPYIAKLVIPEEL